MSVPQTPYGSVNAITNPSEAQKEAIDSAKNTAVQELKCDELLSQVAEYQNQVKGLESMVKSYTDTSTDAAAVITEQQNLITQLLAVKNQTGALESDSAALRVQLEECQKKSIALEERARQLDAQIVELQQQIAALKGQQNPLQSVIEQLVNTIKAHEDQITQIAALKNRIDLESKDITGAEAVAKMESLRQQLTVREEELKGKIANYSEEFNRLPAQLKELQDKITELEAKLAECEAMKQTTNQQIESEGKTKSDIEKRLTECAARENAAVEAYNSFCTKQSTELQKVNSALKTAIDSFNGPLENLKKSINDARTALQQASAQQTSSQ